jgi:hypothetical protein
VAAHFNWSMADRFGGDLGTLGPNGNSNFVATPDGRIDLFNDPNYVQNKDPVTGQRLGYQVNFDASPSTAGGPISSYTWGISTVTGTLTTPLMTLAGAHPAANLVEGTYAVTLTVTADGQSSSEFQIVRVRDILIVSIGDSAASGEGDPDVHGTNGQGVLWADSPHGREADRSGKAAAAKAALQIERADPHTSVTFVSVAASGDATINGLIAPGTWENPLPGGPAGPGEGQLDEVRAIVGNRPIDALLITTGADDIGFTDIVTALVKAPAIGSLSDLYNHLHSPGPTADWSHVSLDQLPGVYDQLAAAIGRTLPNVQNVFLTEYYDPTHNSNGQFVDGGLNDIIPGFQVSAAEESWAYSNVVVPLNNAIHDMAARHGWHLVSGIAAAFLDHGYTAAPGDRWVNTAEESREIEGPYHTASIWDTVGGLAGAAAAGLLGLPVWAGALFGGLSADDIDARLDRMNTKGTAHPNEQGQQAIANILVGAMRPVLNWGAVDPNGPYMVSQAANSLTVTPAQPRTTPDTITLRRSWADPSFFQVVVDGQLLFEGPAASFPQVSVVGGDGGTTFLVDAFPAGTAIRLTGGAGNDTFNVEGTRSPVTVVAGTGHATVNLSPIFHELSNIPANVTVDGNGSATALYIFDQADPAAQAYTIDTGAIRRPRGPALNYGGLSDLTLWAAAVPNTISVEHAGATNTNLYAGVGTSQILLSPTDHNLAALGNLFVNGASTAQLVVYDQNDPISPWGSRNSTYVLNRTTLTHRYDAYIGPYYFPGGPTWAVTVALNYAALGGLTLYTDNVQRNADTVLGTPAPTKIMAGAVADTITVGPALSAVGQLTLDDNGGDIILDERTPPSLSVNVNDRFHSVGYVVKDGSVVRDEHETTFGSNPWRPAPIGIPVLGPGGLVPVSGSGTILLPPPQSTGMIFTTTTDYTTTVTYLHAPRSIEIDAGTVRTTFDIQSTTAGVPVTVRGGRGGTAFAVGDGSVKKILSPVTVIGGGGSLVVDDSAATVRDQVTVSSTQIGAAATDRFFGPGGSLSYSALAAVTLDLSSANDDAVQLTPGGTPFTVNGSSAAFRAGHGAVLGMNQAGVTNAVNSATSPGSGRWTFGNAQPVTYANMAVPLADVTAQLAISAGAITYNAATKHYTQTVTLRNIGTSAIAGPLSLVLDNLTGTASLANKTGTTRNRLPSGSPYLDVALPDNVLGVGQSVTAVLDFVSTNGAAITYHARALAGTGDR